MTRKIEVDLWKTGMHKVEVGIKKQEEHRAKSRQFTADTDIIGEYKYDDEKSEGYITIRTEPWGAELGKKRLIMKIFTKSMNWKGSVEEMVAVGVNRTMATGEPLPVYNLNLNNIDHLIRLERVFKPKSMNKAMYTFMFLDDGKLESYRIEADRLTFGSDWDVFNQYDEKVAVVDGKVMNMGGKWVITINDDDYKLHTGLDEVVLLFASLIKYEEEVREKLKLTTEKLKGRDDSLNLEISPEEADLYENPRRIKI